VDCAVTAGFAWRTQPAPAILAQTGGFMFDSAGVMRAAPGEAIDDTRTAPASRPPEIWFPGRTDGNVVTQNRSRRFYPQKPSVPAAVAAGSGSGKPLAASALSRLLAPGNSVPVTALVVPRRFNEGLGAAPRAL